MAVMSMRAHAACTSGRVARTACARRQTLHARRPAAHASARRALRVMAVVAEPPVVELSREQAIQQQLQASMAVLGQRVESGDALRSTPKQRAIMAAWGTLQAAALAVGVSSVHSNLEAAEAGVAVLAGYLLADLGSGVFHWIVDNYGDASTPALGSIIDAFQGHHARPWTITQRDPSNNLAGPCAVHLAPLLAFCALPMPAPARLFGATFLLFTALAQQTHAWSHLKRGDVPPLVLALQDAGVLISCRAHGAHHRAPFSCQYCIVSGIWNDALDAGVLTSAEQIIYDRFGVAPRGWSEPASSWAQLEEEEQ